MASASDQQKLATLNLSAVPLDHLTQILSTVWPRPVTAEMLQADLTAGAPANADGTINLVHYAAWLVQEMERAD